MTTALITHPDCLNHATPPGHPEQIARLEYINDALSAPDFELVTLSYKLTGKRVFAMAPLHHHFEKKGWAEPTIVIRFWIIATILALIGLSTLKLR